jgi:uncharacterized protein YkwD
MQVKLFRLTTVILLAVALMIAAAPGAQAISYYAYLQQYLNGQQSPQPTPEQPAPPATEPEVNFWSSRAASRKALLNNAGYKPNPTPTPQPNPTPVPQPKPDPIPQPSGLTAREQQMLELINKDRIAYGLRPLQADMRLTRLARLKSQDIVDNIYFAHQSPTYGSAFDMFRANNISFLRGGENLSKAGNVLVSHMRLMNSTNHRANLLTPQYTHVGIGIVDYNYSGIVVTEMFIQKP